MNLFTETKNTLKSIIFSPYDLVKNIYIRYFSENNSKDKKLANLKTIYEHQKSEIISLQKKLEESEHQRISEITKLKILNKTLSNEIKTLTSEKEELLKQYTIHQEEAQNTANSLRTDIEALNIQTVKLRISLEQKETEHQASVKKLKQTQNTNNNKLENKIKELEQELTTLGHNHQTAIEKTIQKYAKYTQPEKVHEITNQKTLLEEQLSKYKTYFEQLKKLDNQINNFINKEHNTIKETIINLQKYETKIMEYSDRIQHYSKKMSQIDADIQRFNLQIVDSSIPVTTRADIQQKLEASVVNKKAGLMEIEHLTLERGRLVKTSEKLISEYNKKSIDFTKEINDHFKEKINIYSKLNMEYKHTEIISVYLEYNKEKSAATFERIKQHALSPILDKKKPTTKEVVSEYHKGKPKKNDDDNSPIFPSVPKTIPTISEDTNSQPKIDKAIINTPVFIKGTNQQAYEPINSMGDYRVGLKPSNPKNISQEEVD